MRKSVLKNRSDKENRIRQSMINKIRTDTPIRIKTEKIMIFRIVITILFTACVAYIWHNSMENAVQSSARSGQVTVILNKILADISKGGKISITEVFVRKSAHFAEYFLESILAVLLFQAYYLKPLKRWWAVLLVGVFTAVVDESIQLFSMGRSAALLDVGIDMLGFSSGMLLAFIIYFFMLILRNRDKSV